VKVSRSIQILAACLGLWIGLVLVLASSLGCQVALPVLLLGIGGVLLFASFLSFKSRSWVCCRNYEPSNVKVQIPKDAPSRLSSVLRMRHDESWRIL
jgi:hypothetical protein